MGRTFSDASDELPSSRGGYKDLPPVRVGAQDPLRRRRRPSVHGPVRGPGRSRADAPVARAASDELRIRARGWRSSCSSIGQTAPRTPCSSTRTAWTASSLTVISSRGPSPTSCPSPGGQGDRGHIAAFHRRSVQTASTPCASPSTRWRRIAPTEPPSKLRPAPRALSPRAQARSRTRERPEQRPGRLPRRASGAVQPGPLFRGVRAGSPGFPARPRRRHPCRERAGRVAIRRHGAVFFPASARRALNGRAFDVRAAKIY